MIRNAWLRHRGLWPYLAFIGLFLLNIVFSGACGGGGGSSSSSSTTGTPTTGTPTTGTPTTGTPTTGTITSGTTTSGTLPANRIFYSVTTTSTDVSHMSPTGTGNTLFVQLPDNIPVAALNHAGTTWAFLYTTDPFGVDPRYDVYTNTTPSITGATRRTSTNFLYAGTIEYTGEDSLIVFTAGLVSPAGDFGVYKIGATSGTATRITNGEEADINLATGKLVITRLASGFGEIATVNLDGSGLAMLTTNANEDWMPQWSKDGTQITFSTDRNGQFDIYRMAANGSGLVRVTSALEDEFGPSFSADDSQLSFTVISGNIANFGVYRINADGTGRTSLFLDSAIHPVTYWTSNTGTDFGSTFTGGIKVGVGNWPRKRGF